MIICIIVQFPGNRGGVCKVRAEAGAGRRAGSESAGIILRLVTMIFRLFKITQFFHLGHSRPSIFLSFYGSQWVWLVLDFFFGMIWLD